MLVTVVGTFMPMACQSLMAERAGTCLSEALGPFTLPARTYPPPPLSSPPRRATVPHCPLGNGCQVPQRGGGGGHCHHTRALDCTEN